MVSDSQAGLLVNPGDVDGLADALMRLLKDSELRRKIQEQAWVEAKQRFHPTVIARQTMAVSRRF